MAPKPPIWNNSQPQSFTFTPPLTTSVVEYKHLVYVSFQSRRDIVCQSQRRIIFALFEEYNSLSPDSYRPGQALLGKIKFGSKFLYPVSHIYTSDTNIYRQAVLHHGAPAIIPWKKTTILPIIPTIKPRGAIITAMMKKNGSSTLKRALNTL